MNKPTVQDIFRCFYPAYRINLNYKYENMSTRYDIPENGSFTATYSNDQTKYTIFDTKRLSITRRNIRRNISNVKKYFTS